MRRPEYCGDILESISIKLRSTWMNYKYRLNFTKVYED